MERFLSSKTQLVGFLSLEKANDPELKANYFPVRNLATLLAVSLSYCSQSRYVKLASGVGTLSFCIDKVAKCLLT